jgi:uncharacterized protein (TIGR00297 family)
MNNLALNLSNPWLFAIGLNTLLLIIGLIAPKKLLTVMGYLHAWVLGVIVWGCLQWQGYLIVMFYFLVGSAITRVGMAEKLAAGIAEKREGKRGPENVWGSALIATICAILSLVFPEQKSFFLIGYVASFATKLSDTCASEIGKVYGKRTFLITTFQPVPKGTEGAVSLEGTLAGIIASVAIAGLAWSINMIEAMAIVICILAAFIATNLESVIGATLQEKFVWLTNEVVNIINTLIGALFALICTYLFLVH